MNKLFSGIINHAFFAIGIALGVGVLGMVGLVQVYSFFWEEEEQVAEIENPVERALTGTQLNASVETFNIRGLVGQFLNGDNQPLGTIFLDVAIDVAGEEYHAEVDAKLDVLTGLFTEHLRNTGIGRSDLPGEADLDRIGNSFLALARDEVDLRGIIVVRVSEAEGIEF